MKNKELKQVLLYLGIVLFLSYFVFWGPIALFKIETANLTQGTTGPIWALMRVSYQEHNQLLFG